VVLSSAAEAEMGALFYNAKEAAWLRTTLEDMGHPQPATPIQTDNACAAGIANGTVKQRRSKAIDMRFYWIRDRVAQGQFVVHWRRGTDNLADYFTKHHSPAHHRLMRSRYILDLHRPSAPVRGGEGVLIPPGYPESTNGPEPTSRASWDPARVRTIQWKDPVASQTPLGPNSAARAKSHPNLATRANVGPIRLTCTNQPITVEQAKTSP
jgi:hypothetical protein